MKIRILLIAVFALILSGCVGTPDKSGWHSSQKQEFMQILKSDKYLSLCDQKPLYEQVKKSNDSQLMTKLLVGYTNNLANSCIVQPVTTAYRQKVSVSHIQAQLRAGKSIEKILHPYVPEYKLFAELSAKYKALKKSGASPKTLHKIRMSIERIKLMKPGLGKVYALVNIPEFKVHLIENDMTTVTMKVVVGKRKHETPIFSENLSYITLNPTWNVPDSIARNEIIPKTLRNPGYLKAHRLVIRKDYNLDSPPLKFNPSLARNYVGGKGPVPFKFIEVPSNKNALGRVKFIFPNQHSVYMHDTPAKSLFKRKSRAFSHGCVRLEKPQYMLQYLSQNYTAHEWEDVQKKLKSMKTHYLKITKKLPVHTAYLTAYVDDEGVLKTFNDIYGYDASEQLNFTR